MRMVEAIRTDPKNKKIHQLVSQKSCMTLQAFCAQIESGDSEMNFAPQFYRGGGQEIPAPKRQKISYEEALSLFEKEISALKSAGFEWRD